MEDFTIEELKQIRQILISLEYPQKYNYCMHISKLTTLIQERES